MGGVSEQFYSFCSFLPRVEGSHQRRPFCWGRSELDGQSCDVHVHVQRPTRRCLLVRSRTGNATSTPLRSGPFLFSSHASLPLPLQTWSHFLFVLLELSPPFPCFSHKTCALLGLGSRTSRLSWRPQPCRKHSLRPPRDATQRRNNPKDLAIFVQDGAWPLERQAARQAEGRNVAIQPDSQDSAPLQCRSTTRGRGVSGSLCQPCLLAHSSHSRYGHQRRATPCQKAKGPANWTTG